MAPAIAPTKQKLKPWMLKHIQAMTSPDLNALLTKFYKYLTADDALGCCDSFRCTMAGPREGLCPDPYKTKLDQHHLCGGIAVPLPSLNLGKLAIDTQDLFINQLHDYAKFHSTWRQMLTNTTEEQLDSTWLHLREVVVIVHDSNEPEFGTLHAANLDVQHWSLVWQYCHTVDTTNDPSSIALRLLRKSIRHYPVTFELIKIAPDLQVKSLSTVLSAHGEFEHRPRGQLPDRLGNFEDLGQSPGAVE